MFLGLVDESAAPAASGPGLGGAALDGGDRGRGVHVGVDGVVVVVELGEGLGEVLGVNELVRGVLEAHLPSVRRRGRGADEEELASVGQLEVAVLVREV